MKRPLSVGLFIVPLPLLAIGAEQFRRFAMSLGGAPLP